MASISIVEIFAANLRATRRERGALQIEVANSAGFEHEIYRQAERGEKSPTLTTVQAIAYTLSVEPVDLIAK